MVQASAPPPVSESPPAAAVVRYSLAEFSDAWLIPKEPVPESAWHDRCLELFKAVLDEWVASTRRDAAVFRDIAIRANRSKPAVGWNPDICLVEPAPAGAAELESMRLWEHSSPRLAFEAVSPNHPYKDYVVIPDKCAAGVEELCVFDPLLAGSPIHGGPCLLQLWRRANNGDFERTHAGDGPAHSAVLGAWLIPDRTSQTLRVAEQPNGTHPWPTATERAELGHRAALAREAEARQGEAEARQREAEARQGEAEALRRVSELEQELRRRG
ncbi:MAG TPA: hypothetical protein VFZ53_15680 [Polyangiaceae bacterium]